MAIEKVLEARFRNVLSEPGNYRIGFDAAASGCGDLAGKSILISNKTRLNASWRSSPAGPKIGIFLKPVCFIS